MQICVMHCHQSLKIMVHKMDLKLAFQYAKKFEETGVDGNFGRYDLQHFKNHFQLCIHICMYL